MSDGLATLPNVFQQLMLQWERFAPYNAGQFVTLDRTFTIEGVAGAFRDIVISMGLQQIGQHPDAPVVETAEPIEEFITGSMNTPFAPGDSPLRPFFLIEGQTTHVGLIYRHVVADSASIRLVMRRWIERLLEHGQSKLPFDPVTPLRDRFGGLWRAHGVALVRESLGEIIRMSRMKQVRRLVDNDPKQPVAWKQIELEEGLIEGLKRSAKSSGVRINDLFVAAAAEACNRHLPHEESDKRRDLAVGTIVDTRPANDDIHARFGLSLGVLQTIWRWQQLQSWQTTFAAAASTSALAKRRDAARSSELRIAAAVWHGQRLARHALATFYRKRCPLSAGISNVNLTPQWPARFHPSPLRGYTRVSPLGPMLPIVFTPTTLGSRLDLGVTYRTRVVPERVAQLIIDSLVTRLRMCAQTGTHA